MATEVERLAVLIEANTKSYERAMARMQQQTERAIRGSTQAVSKLDAALSQTGASLTKFVRGFAAGAIGAGVAALADMAKNAISSAAAIGDLADRAGISTTAIQQLQYGAAQANMSFEELSDGLLKFSRGIGDAQRGQGELLDLFNSLDIRLTDAGGRFKDVNTLLGEFSNAVQNAGNQSEAMSMIITAFGRGGADWLEFLGNGAAGLRKFGEAANDAGAVVDEALIRRAQEFDDAWAAATTAAAAHIKSWALTSIEWISKAGAALNDVLQNSLRGNAIQQMLGVHGPTQNRGGGPLEGGTIVYPVSNAAGKENLDTQALKKAESDAAAARREHEAAVRRVASAYEDLGKTMEDVLNEERELSDSVKFFGEQGLDAFESMITGGQKLTDVLRNLGNALLHAVLQASLLGQGPLATLFGTGSTQTAAGGILGSIFGYKPAARQHGGSMSAGHPYVVGERGPELVVPGRQSYVVPNKGMGGGGGTQIHMHFEQGIDATETRTQGPQGERVDIMVKRLVRSEISSAMKPTLRDQYGIQPVTRRRF